MILYLLRKTLKKRGLLEGGLFKMQVGGLIEDLRYFCFPIFRLRDEEIVCVLITKLQSYLEANGSRSEICRVYLRHIEHLYYKVCIVNLKEKVTPNKNNLLSRQIKISH